MGEGRVQLTMDRMDRTLWEKKEESRSQRVREQDKPLLSSLLHPRLEPRLDAAPHGGVVPLRLHSKRPLTPLPNGWVCSHFLRPSGTGGVHMV